MSINSIVIMLFLVMIISAIVIKYSQHRFIKKYKKLLIGFLVVLPSFVSLSLIIKQGTDTQYDFLVAMFLWGILFAVVEINEIISKSYTIVAFSYFSIVYLVVFLMLNKINMHLLSNFPIVPLLFLIAFISFSFIKTREDKKLLIRANIIGILLVFVTSCVFSIPLNGITKQERIAQEYLLEQKGYERSDIIEISDFTYPKEGKNRFLLVKVQTNNGVEDYTLHYKSGKIIEIEKR